MTQNLLSNLHLESPLFNFVFYPKFHEPFTGSRFSVLQPSQRSRGNETLSESYESFIVDSAVSEYTQQQ